MVSLLQAGEQLEGKYTIRNRIGEGGMGVVYEAEHNDLHLRVAIKVLRPLEAVDPNMITRFKAEARSAASIRHPNVIEVTDYGITPDNRPFFVMEFLDGESLADRIDKKAFLSEREIVEILDQILSGLASAHKKGIIHRDLKPENILITRGDNREVVKILDFGIAKIMGGHTMANQTLSQDSRPKTEHGIVLGTPGYMAPESITGQGNVDTRADLFSIGVLMYEMMTGRLPFQGNDVHSIMLDTVTRPVPRPTAINATISEAMERLCLTALAKNPNDRFQSAEELIHQLTAAAVGRIPENARACNTRVGLPSIIPAQGASLKKAPLDQNTSELDYFQVNIPSPLPKRSVSRSSLHRQKYKGPARSRKFFLPISPLTILFVLGVLAAFYFFFFRAETRHLINHEENSRIGKSLRERTPPDHSKKFDAYIKTISDKAIPNTVTIWVDITPQNAVITVKGKKIKERPLLLKGSSKPLKVVITAKGYRKKIVLLTPDAEQTLSATLKKRKRKKK